MATKVNTKKQNGASPEVSDPIIGPRRFSEVRAAFVRNETTLNKWCLANTVHPSRVRTAFLIRGGPAAEALRNRVLKACGLLA